MTEIMSVLLGTFLKYSKLINLMYFFQIEFLTLTTDLILCRSNKIKMSVNLCYLSNPTQVALSLIQQEVASINFKAIKILRIPKRLFLRSACLEALKIYRVMNIIL
jgi:hypothetical protein